MGVPGLIRVNSSLSSLESIESSSQRISGVERCGREKVTVKKLRANHALLDIVFDKGVDGRFVRSEPVFPRVVPDRDLLFQFLSQVNNREASPIAEDVVVGDLLRLIERVIEFCRKIGTLPVELSAHDDHMYRSIDTGFSVEFLILAKVVG